MWSFIKKEFLYIFRDYRTMIILFGMPLAQIILFGFAITNDINNAHIAVLDNSKDVVTREITRKLLSSHYFILDRNLKSNKDIKSAFKKGEIKQTIVFEQNFAKKLTSDKKANMQLILDASNPNTASILNAYTAGIVDTYIFQNLLQKGKIPMQINVQSKMLYNQELKSVYLFVPGIITVVLMLVSAMMTSITIVREKELGTMEALLVSPVKSSTIIIGKVVPYVVLSFINLIIILFLSVFIFGMPIRGSVLLLLAESLLFLIMSLSLGIFISTASKTQQQAMLLSMFGLMLPTILLSGFIFPIANMPVALQILSDFMPGKWFIIIIKNIMLKGIGFSYFWKETVIILAMTVLFAGLSMKRFNIRLSE